MPVSGVGKGASGGVLLHVIDKEAAYCGNLSVTYRYFDIFYAGAVAAGLYNVRTFPQNQARELLRKIQAGAHGERITLPIAAFLPIRSPAAVIALRFHLPSPTNYASVIRTACELAERREVVKEFGEIWRESIAPWVI